MTDTAEAVEATESTAGRTPKSLEQYVSEPATDLQSRFSDFLLGLPGLSVKDEASFREGVRLGAVLRGHYQKSDANREATAASRAAKAAEREARKSEWAGKAQERQAKAEERAAKAKERAEALVAKAQAQAAKAQERADKLAGKVTGDGDKTAAKPPTAKTAKASGPKEKAASKPVAGDSTPATGGDEPW